MLKKTEEHNMISENERIKFVETSGTKYIDFLKTPNPFHTKCKAEENCIVCKNSNENTDCKVNNVGYSLQCKLCKKRNKEISYEGETARSGYLRQREHMKELEKKSKRSVLFKHVMNDHRNEEDDVEFEMKIVGRFTSALNRQVDESIRIRNKPPSSLLNSKSEFYGPCIKRKVYE